LNLKIYINKNEEIPMDTQQPSIFAKKWFKVIVLCAVTVTVMYVMIYIDVVLRAKNAYLEGEKYWSWYENPERKKSFLDNRFKKDKDELDKKYAKKKWTEEDYNRQMDIIKFNYEREMEESSIKYAYIWYQTAVELFSPPRSKWVKLAEKKMPEAKKLWRQELTSKGIKVEDYMLE